MLVSKSLFKQSWKANFQRWIIVTLASCFIVASVILIVGKLNLGEIKGSVDDLMDSAQIQKDIQTEAIGSYEDLLDVFTDIYVNYKNNVDVVDSVVKGTAEKKDYEDFPDEFKDAVNKINDAQYQISNGKKEISEAEQQYQDGMSQYESSKAAYSAKLKELEANKVALTSGIAKAKKELADLQDKYSQVNLGIEQLETSLATIESYQSQLQDLKTKQAQLQAIIAQIEGLPDEEKEARQTELETYKTNLAQVEVGIAQIEGNLPDEETIAGYRAKLAELQTNKTALEDGISQYQTGIAKNETLLKQVTDGIDRINSGLSDAKYQLDEAEIQITNAKQEIRNAEQTLSSSKKELYDKTKDSIVDNIIDTVYEKAIKENGIETAEKLQTAVQLFINDIDSGQIGKQIDIEKYVKDYIGNEVYNEVIKDNSEEDSRTAQRIALDAIDSYCNMISAGYSRDEAVEEITKDVLDRMPEGVSDALYDIKDVNMYALVIGSILFRIAGLLLPIIFVIMTGTNLLAGQVDSGSMAYILSTPIKRKKVAFTQMIYLITSVVLMYALICATGVICVGTISNEMFELTQEHIAMFSIGALCTIIAISGICFCASGIFNREKDSLSVGGGISISFLVCAILGLFGEKIIPSIIRIDAMNYFNYLTIFSFFKVKPMIDGLTDQYVPGLCILILIGLIAYNIGIVTFDKKDLPL